MFELLTQSTWADRIGWMLVHSLWQFALVAVLAVALQWALKRCTAVTRYRALLTALGIMVALPVVTWLWPWSAEAPSAAVALHSAETAEQGLVDQHPYSSPGQRPDSGTAMGAVPIQAPGELSGAPQGEPRGLEPASLGSASPFSLLQRRIQPWLPEIVLIWFAGVSVAALRPLLSWYTVRRLRTVGVSPVSDAVHTVMERAAARLGVARAVEALQSTLVKAPVVVGYFRPAILLPLSVLTGLPESQLELILAHELAHIRRHDYLVNVLQTLVETLFFYHPGVWWLSRAIREERENCCDDVAMAAQGNRADYGRALLAVEELRAASTALSLAARGGSLVNRIRRIAGCEPALRIAGGGSILCILLVSLAVFVGLTWGTAPATVSPEQSAAATATDTPAEANDEAPDLDDWQPGQTLDVQVIHAETKKPLPGVRLDFQYHGPGINFRDITTTTTDAEGRSQGRLPDLRPDAVRIYPSKAGFVPLRVYWGDDLPSPKLPKAVTIPMQPGTVWGGVVQNENGEPIANVEVNVRYWEKRPEFNPHLRVNIDQDIEGVTTDKDGRWRMDILPAQFTDDGPRLFVTHPDYVSDHLEGGSTPLPVTERPSYEALRAETAVMVMRKGATITGRVTDEAGTPISGALICNQYDCYDPNPLKNTATTDDEGHFRLSKLSHRQNYRDYFFTVQAAGYAPVLVEVSDYETARPVEIKLKRGQAVEGRVVDEDGKPLEGVSIKLDRWMGRPRQFHLKTTTDADGEFRIHDAPPERTEYELEKKGYITVRTSLSPSSQDYRITLRPPVWIVGSIVDAETNQPLPKCTLTKGWEPDDGRAPQWHTRIGYRPETITNGRYEIELGQEDHANRVRVEAEGYMPAVSRAFKPYDPDRGRVTYDIKLTRSPPMTGIVLGPGNEPLANAEVFLATDLFRVEDGKPMSGTLRGVRTARTNAAGRFELPPEVEPFYLVVLHEQGFAVINEEQFAGDSAVRIEPWTDGNRSFEAERRPFTHSRRPVAADAEGVLTVRLIDEDGKPVEGAQVATSVSFRSRPNRFAPYESNWTFYSSAVSDGDGMARIADEHMTCVVARHAERKLVAVQDIPLEPTKRPDSVTLTMHPHCKVSGKLTAKELEARGRKLTWTNVYLYLENGMGRPMNCMSENADYFFYVPPGSYKLHPYGTDTQHGVQKAITVEPGQQELEVEPIDLPPAGLVLLEGKPAPELRDVVAWKNGGPVKLSDLKGKVVVLAFSAHWMADRPHEWMPNLFTICDKYRDQGLAIVDIRLDMGLGIDSQVKLDEKIAEVESPFWGDRDLPIPIALGLTNRPPFLNSAEEKKVNGYLPCAILEDYGVNSFPSGVLIDRKGRVVGEFNLRSDRDNAVLEKMLKED